jgi:hypothetical protein
MKWVLLISIIVSCSSHMLLNKKRIEKRWSVLESAVDKKWNQKKVLFELGKPENKDLDNESESWFYYSSDEGGQEWSISFRLKDKTVSYVGFNSPESIASEFTLDKILKRWKKLNCKKKKSKMYAKGHSVYRDQYYLCDGKKRIDYNRYKEVSWIRVGSVE